MLSWIVIILLLIKMPELSKNRKYWIARFKSKKYGNWRGPDNHYKFCSCYNSKIRKKTKKKYQISCICGKDMWDEAKQDEDNMKDEMRTQYIIKMLKDSITNGTSSEMVKIFEEICDIKN